MKRPILALLLIGVWASAATAQPAGGPEDPQELIAEPREVRAGDDITVSGEGCAPGNQVKFELYDPDLHSSATGLAQGDGSFVQSVNLPTTTKVGRSWLRATCLTPESEQRVMEAVILVNRPEFVITWVNVIFGLGTAFVVAGIGLAMLRQSDSRRHPTSRGGRRRGRRGGHRKRKRSSSRSSRSSSGGESSGIRGGPASNGSRDSVDRPVEVD
jgi:hypothetical protein